MALHRSRKEEMVCRGTHAGAVAERRKRTLQNLRSMTDKTVVFVTHRPAALEICDRVIDFSRLGENGRGV